MKKFAFFDVDYTLYDGYLATNFNLFLTEAGYADKSIAAAEDKLKDEYLAGVIDYREASRRAIQLTADSLSGQSVDLVKTWQNEFVGKYGAIFTWVPALLEKLQRQDFQIFLISAAPAPPLEAIAEKLQVNNWYGTELEIVNCKYTGRLKTILNFEEKLKLIKTLISENEGLHVGFGDSLGDVDMLSVMDRAYVYNPRSEKLIALAKTRGWIFVNEKNILEKTKSL